MLSKGRKASKSTAPAVGDMLSSKFLKKELEQYDAAVSAKSSGECPYF